MPNKKQILFFWADTLINDYGKYRMDVVHDYDHLHEATETCMACGTRGITERAHIIPSVNGGSNELKNLHLLCRECHLESEHFDTNELYFEWFKYKNELPSGSHIRQLNTAMFFAKMVEENKKHLLPERIVNILPYESNT